MTTNEKELIIFISELEIDRYINFCKRTGQWEEAMNAQLEKPLKMKELYEAAKFDKFS